MTAAALGTRLWPLRHWRPGVDPRFSRLYRWAHPRAVLGQARAQYLLGRAYALGHGVERDPAQARHWFHLAAHGGHAAAQFECGLDRQYGPGRCLKQARRWYRLGAQGGHAAAALWYGGCLQHGWGGARDHAGALHWYQKAAARGSEGACYQLLRLYLDMPGQEGQAARWGMRLARGGHGEARLLMADLYAGRGRKGRRRAATLYRAAARQGAGVGAYNLAGLLYQGLLGRADAVAAGKWWHIAAALGYGRAHGELRRLQLLDGGGAARRGRILAQEWMKNHGETDR